MILVSARPLISPLERIVAYDFRMKSAYVEAMPKLPDNWVISVFNFQQEDPAWQVIVRGKAKSSRFGIPPSFFENFVELDTSDASSDFKTFDAELELTISEVNRSSRKITIPRSEMRVVNVGERND